MGTRLSLAPKFDRSFVVVKPCIKMSNSKMLVTSPSYTRNAVLIGLGKAHNRGGTSTVYCLELGKVHVQGRPFRLERLNRNRGLYIWDNDFIRDQDIKEGSIVSFQGSWFVGNTDETMVSAVKKIPVVT